MIDPKEEKEIIELIYRGFDLELISFELDIPIEQLQEYKKQAEIRKDVIDTEIEISESKNTNKKKNESTEEQENNLDYERLIKKYKQEIEQNPQNILTKQNLLAFTYFKAGMIDESRDELLKLIDKSDSYMAYRQLVHLEKLEGNLDDAKLWAYEAIEKFPDSIGIRKQLLSIAKDEKDNQEVIRQIKEIIRLNPENNQNKKRLQKIISNEEREL